MATASHFGRADILSAARALRMVDTSSTSPARLISVLCDERMSADELASRIEIHPALCARVLQVANSPYYGQVRAVTTVKRALLLLGVNAIRGIATAACIERVMPSNIAALPDIPAFLRHSLATAVAADMLAVLHHPMLAPDAFVAGIIHNLGVVLQASLDPDGTRAMLTARRADLTLGMRSLEEHTSAPHEECAAVLFDEWQLPESLVSVALHHHNADAAPAGHRLLVTLVSTAADLALCCGHTFSLERNSPAFDSVSLNYLGLSIEAIGNILAALPQRIDELTRSFC